MSMTHSFCNRNVIPFNLLQIYIASLHSLPLCDCVFWFLLCIRKPSIISKFPHIRSPGTSSLEPVLRSLAHKTIVKVSANLCCVCMLSGFSHVWLCDPMDYSTPGSSVYGILQARILEWVGMPSSRGSSWPGIEPSSHISCTSRWVLDHSGGSTGDESASKLMCVVGRIHYLQ